MKIQREVRIYQDLQARYDYHAHLRESTMDDISHHENDSMEYRYVNHQGRTLVWVMNPGHDESGNIHNAVLTEPGGRDRYVYCTGFEEAHATFSRIISNWLWDMMAIIRKEMYSSLLLLPVSRNYDRDDAYPLNLRHHRLLGVVRDGIRWVEIWQDSRKAIGQHKRITLLSCYVQRGSKSASEFKTTHGAAVMDAFRFWIQEGLNIGVTITEQDYTAKWMSREDRGNIRAMFQNRDELEDRELKMQHLRKPTPETDLW